MRECVMVDLEGTLSDSRWRQDLLGAKDYDKWNDGLAVDTKNPYVCALVVDLSKTYDIIIATAKPMKYRKMVFEWLEENCPELVPIDILMRHDGDMDGSPDIKAKLVADLRNNGYEIVMAIDDREDVLERLANEGIVTIDPTPLLVTAPNAMATKKPKKKATVAGLMKEAGKLFKSRNKEYGESYLTFGKLCDATFPDGLTIKGYKAWTRFGIIFQQLIKTTRIAQTFSRTGKAHLDSCRDAGVYSFMLEEVETNFQMKEGS